MPDEFEQYLKSFQPRAPEPLPRLSRRPSRRWWWIPAAIAACLTVAFWLRPPVEKPTPFTIEASSALLASETPWNDVLDASAFQYQSAAPRSVIKLLSQEKLSQ
jgi:hypothetical protein